MKVFVTGATGYLGSTIVEMLREKGHEVLGLARNDAAVEKLEALGVLSHRGDIEAPETLAEGARRADAVIHTAFIHDFDAYAENARLDETAVRAMATALERTDRPFVVATGTAGLEPGVLATEEDTLLPGTARQSEVALQWANRGVRACTVRLPPTVHGPGDRAFIAVLMDIARRTGFSAYVGDGTNRWPAVHRLDAARLFVAALEKALPGQVLHGVAESGLPFRAIATAIAERLSVPTRSVPPESATSHFGWLSFIVPVDNPLSNHRTRATMEWEPREIGLLEDLRAGTYD
ncbi:MAG: SDR family oxidoreductase [Myxococcota bacterium]